MSLKALLKILCSEFNPTLHHMKWRYMPPNRLHGSNSHCSRNQILAALSKEEMQTMFMYALALNASSFSDVCIGS